MPTKRVPAAMPPPVGDDVQDVTPGPGWGVQVGAPNGAAFNPAEFEDEPEESPVDRVFAVLESARGAERASVKLYRVTKPNGYAWCDDYSIEDFEAGGFAMIREKWGPGEYEIRLYALRPSDGRMGVLSKPRIVIEASSEAQKNPVPAAPSVDPALREMLSQMANNQAAMLQALTQRPDPMANMQQMLALAASFKQAFGGESSGQKSSISDIVQAVREIREVSKEISPEKETDDDSASPMKLLPSVLELVSKFAPQQGAASMQPAPAFPAVTLPSGFGPMLPPSEPLPNPAPDSLPVAQPSSDDPSDEEMNALQMVLMRGYLSRLCAMSAAGNVEAAAEYALDKLPDEAFEVLENPAWFEALSSFYPAAANHREWLTKVRDRVVVLANEG